MTSDDEKCLKYRIKPTNTQQHSICIDMLDGLCVCVCVCVCVNSKTSHNNRSSGEVQRLYVGQLTGEQLSATRAALTWAACNFHT